MTLDDIYNEIKTANSFALFTHENPDGDAIGSACAVAEVLKNLGKTDIDIYLKEYPEMYNFVPSFDLIKSEVVKENYDMAIVLDCGSLERVSSGFRKVFNNATIKAQIDHHNKNTMFADYNVVNPASPACCQLLASSFQYLDIEITKSIAECLMTGIVTDTYGFSSIETTADCYEFAAWALSIGVNIPKIYTTTLRRISKTRFQIENLAKERLEFLADGRISYTYITKKDEEKIGTKPGDTDSIVEIGRNIEGVEVSVFIYENEVGFKASLRSNDYVDVSKICFTFGGGGHLRAAGVNLAMSLEDAKNTIINETIKYLK